MDRDLIAITQAIHNRIQLLLTSHSNDITKLKALHYQDIAKIKANNFANLRECHDQINMIKRESAKTKEEVLNELLKYIPLKPKQEPVQSVPFGQNQPPPRVLPPQPLDAIFKEIVENHKVNLVRVETKFRESKLNNKKCLEEIKT